MNKPGFLAKFGWRSKRAEDVHSFPGFSGDLISLCPDAIIALNRDGRIILFNQSAERLTGYSAAEVVGRKSIDIVYGSLEKARAIKKQIHGLEYGGPGRLEGFETEILIRDGGKVPVRLSATLLYQDAYGRDSLEVGSVGFFHDITERKRFENQLRELSIRDGLSGLYNHRHFHSVLHEELGRAQRHGRFLSLICIDLDKFKQFNDGIGHLEADNIIRLIGQSLKQLLRESDHAFRYGGDEFMVLLPETDIANAQQVAERIRQYFNSNWPFADMCDKYKLSPVTLSLGVAEANLQDNPKNLVKRADLAMYEAKRAGGDQTVQANGSIGVEQ